MSDLAEEIRALSTAINDLAVEQSGLRADLRNACEDIGRMRAALEAHNHRLRETEKAVAKLEAKYTFWNALLTLGQGAIIGLYLVQK